MWSDMTLCDPMDYSTPDPWNPPGKNTGVGSHSFHHGIFPTQGSNLGLLHCRQILYLLSHQGMVILTSHNHSKKEQSWSFPIHEWGQLLKKKNRYLFGCARFQLWHVGSTSCDMLLDSPVAAYRIQFPDQVWNLGAPHWERRVSATGPPGKSWDSF